MRLAVSIVAAAAMLGAALIPPAQATGDLSKQDPIEVTVDLGMGSKHVFVPDKLRFETGKLYKLVLRNASKDPHYFTSHAFSQLI